MKKIALTLFCIICLSFSTANALIQTVSFGDSFGDDYSFKMQIWENSDPAIFHAMLMNTSLGVDPLIDSFGFNIQAVLDTDFYIDNISDGWELIDSGHIQFNVFGDSDRPLDKLSKGEYMTFDFHFTNSSVIPDNPFELWTLAPISFGGGFGGGDVSGQVAVSFQRLGEDGEFSELLTGNWEPLIPELPSVPEPPIYILIISSIFILYIAYKKNYLFYN